VPKQKKGHGRGGKIYLADMIVPFLLSNSHFDCFLHKTR
jgi:hypothetical protein